MDNIFYVLCQAIHYSDYVTVHCMVPIPLPRLVYYTNLGTVQCSTNT